MQGNREITSRIHRVATGFGTLGTFTPTNKRSVIGFPAHHFKTEKETSENNG